MKRWLVRLAKLLVALAALALGAWSLVPMLLPQAERQPFRDVNDVRSIRWEEGRLRFESRNGERLWDPRDGSWTVRVSDGAAVPADDERGWSDAWISLHSKESEALVPPWYPLPTYGVVFARVEQEGPWLLIGTAGEGAEPTNDVVIDVARRFYYEMPAQDSRALLVTSSDIWLGHPRGITRIRRESGRRSDYVVLPDARAVSGWAEHGGLRYVATADGELVALDAQGGVTSLELPLLSLVSAAFPRVDGEIAQWARDARWRLTNPVVWNGRLHVGAFATNPLGLWAQSQDVLLTRDLATGEWSVRSLPDGLRPRHLFAHGGRLWIAGGWEESGEGGWFAEWGGIAMLGDDQQMLAIERCVGRPLKSWRIEEDAVAFLSVYGNYDDGRRYAECRVEAETGSTDGWRELAADDPRIAAYPERSFEQSPERDPLAGWRVRHRVVERTDRSLKIFQPEEP